MAKFNFMDVLALAKSGWTPSAVKELMEMEVKEEGSTDQQAKADTKEEGAQSVTHTESKVEQADEKEDEPDYKALYLKSQEDLKAAQAANRKQDTSDINEKSYEDMLNDIFSSYM